MYSTPKEFRPDRQRRAQLLGDKAQQRAETYLRQRGYKIVARNFRRIGCEIDLIGLRENTLVFFEVKYRLSPPNSEAERAALLPRNKVAALRRGANAYINLHQDLARKHPIWRFDLLLVCGDHVECHVDVCRS